MSSKRILLLLLLIAAITRTYNAEEDDDNENDNDNDNDNDNGKESPPESQNDEPNSKAENEPDQDQDQDHDKDQDQDQDKDKDQPGQSDKDEDDDDASPNEAASKNDTEVTSEATPSAPRAPEESYFLVGTDDKICVAVNLEVGFVFNVLSVEGTNMSKNFNLPEKAPSYGDCGEDNQKPHLTIECDEDVKFTMLFEKTDEGESWAVTEMALHLNPSKLFRKENEGSSLTLTAGDVSMFAAPMKQSFSCNDPLDGIAFYTTNNTPAAYAVISSIRMQAFDVPEDYGSERICNVVNEASPSRRVEHRSDTAPIAVGLTLAILTLFGVTGFAVHRIMHQKKVDYSNM